MDKFLLRQVLVKLGVVGLEQRLKIHELFPDITHVLESLILEAYDTCNQRNIYVSDNMFEHVFAYDCFDCINYIKESYNKHIKNNYTGD